MTDEYPPGRARRADLSWYKARRSTNNGQCVEVASTGDGVALRDSKDPEGPVLIYTKPEFSAFLEGARNGEFDRFAH